MRVAIVKPDHIGDLVLSTPAIRAVAKAQPDTTLFVSRKCVALAHALFPELNVRVLALPHLGKGSDLADRQADLAAYDVTVILRRDAVVTEEWARLRTREYLMIEDSHADHQSVLDYACVLPLTGDYDIDACFYAGVAADGREQAVRPIRTVGLAIGSGFYANAWPVTRWIALARTLREGGREAVVLCGSAERPQAELIAARAGLGADAIRVGGIDYGDFFAQLADVDVTVASDGGTAHLCSLRTPVVSLFGPSPLFRYAPFGRWNRAMSLRLACSPCCQYAVDIVNGCLTVECMAALTAADMMTALDWPVRREARAREVRLPFGRHLFVGLSHLGRDAKLAARRRERERWSA